MPEEGNRRNVIRIAPCSSPRTQSGGLTIFHPRPESGIPDQVRDDGWKKISAGRRHDSSSSVAPCHPRHTRRRSDDPPRYHSDDMHFGTVLDHYVAADHAAYVRPHAGPDDHVPPTMPSTSPSRSTTIIPRCIPVMPRPPHSPHRAAAAPDRRIGRAPRPAPPPPDRARRARYCNRAACGQTPARAIRSC